MKDLFEEAKVLNEGAIGDEWWDDITDLTFITVTQEVYRKASIYYGTKGGWNVQKVDKKFDIISKYFGGKGIIRGLKSQMKPHGITFHLEKNTYEEFKTVGKV